MKRLITFWVLILGVQLLSAQTFIDINANVLTGIENAGVDWGDYDNDGDLDLIMVGANGATSKLSRIYTNNGGGSFSDIILPGIPGYNNADANWGDFDNDGDLDYMMTGSISSCAYSPLVRNDDICMGQNSLRKFVDIVEGCQKMSYGSVDWGDFDNDGDLDMVMLGAESSTRHVRVYQNIDDSMHVYAAGISGLAQGVAKWVDYDNDQDLDLFVAGQGPSGNEAHLYQNTGGVFTNSGEVFQGVDEGDCDWGDYDNDGDLDLILVGDTSYREPFVMLYQNNAGNFTPIVTGILGVRQSTVKWGDYDNDGDLDILLAGDTSTASSGSDFFTDVYRNDGANVFTQLDLGILGYRYSNARWGDHDNDGDLDFILTGYNSAWPYRAGDVFSNQLAAGSANTIPNSPTGLTEVINVYDVQLNWNKSTDNETPQDGLNYNIRIGSTPNGVEVMSPMSDLNNGYRRKAEVGNAECSNSWIIKNLSPGDYYWNVQAIDGAFAGSQFSSQSKFTILDTAAPTLQYPLHSEQNVAIDTVAHWYSYPGAIGYHIQIDSSDSFGAPFFENTLVLDTQITFALTLETQFYWRVRAYTASDTSAWSYVRPFTTLTYFTETDHNIISVMSGRGQFGDYDNDEDLDLVITGSDGFRVTRVYENVNGVYSDISAAVADLSQGDCKWGDFDNDGDLDLLTRGNSATGWATRIYENNAGVFTDLGNITASGGEKVAFADYDNDGDLDFAMLGFDVYRNDGGVFNPIGAGFAWTTSGDLEWGDYDGDNDMDLIMTGSQGGSGYSTRIYRNDRGSFTEIIHGMQTMTHYARARWGDYDQDGDLDVLLVGQTSATPYNWAVYRNDAGIFNLLQAVPDGINYGDGHWGDLDNDGDLDVVVAGGEKAYVYIFNGSQFVRLTSLVGVDYASVDLGDYDGDEDLDILVTGAVQYDNTPYEVTKLYRNNAQTPNTRPLPPTNLLATFNTDSINFSWSMGSDNETAASGLYYNIYVGSAPSSIDTVSPMADVGNGERRVVAIGNAGSNLTWMLDGIAPGLYYWSVQSIDNNFAPSDFAPEQFISIITDVEENEDRTTLVYPNPSKGEYIIYYQGSSSLLQLDLINMAGQVVSHKVYHNVIGGIKINNQNSILDKGVYILQIKSDEKVSKQRIIVN